MRRPRYVRAWVAVVLAMAAFEAYTLLNEDADDTLSYHIWAARDLGWGSRAMIGAFCAWLFYHWIISPRGEIGWRDLAALVAGSAVALLAGPSR